MVWLHWEVTSMALQPLNVAGSSRFGWPVRWHVHDNLGPGYKKNPFSGETSSHHVKCPHTLRPPCSEKPMEMLHGRRDIVEGEKEKGRVPRSPQGPDEQEGLSWHQVDQWRWSPSSICGLQKRQWGSWLGLSHQVWGTGAACARGAVMLGSTILEENVGEWLWDISQMQDTESTDPWIEAWLKKSHQNGKICLSKNILKRLNR